MSFLEKLAKELEKRAVTHSVPVKINLDASGYLDRTCPYAPCQRGFKVLYADDDKFGNDGWCVYCGHTETNQGFSTAEQRAHAVEVMNERAAQLFHDALTEAARNTPRTTRTSGDKYANVTVTESVDVPPPRLEKAHTPPSAWEVMRVEAACDGCGCRFAGLGACYFCPACGHRSAELTFDQTLRRLRSGLSKHAELEAAIGKEDAADLIGKLTEDGIQTCVTAFEAFAKDAFPRLAPGVSLPWKTVFQKLASGSALWSQHGGRPFEQALTPAEYVELGRYFQQRHLLAHNNGIVDAAYLTATTDVAYAVGQRLAVHTQDALRMTWLVEKLVAALRADLP